MRFGIDAQHIPRLTERFYRVDSSRSSETGGTGLGLAIVKHILMRHDGELEVSSEIGKGSRFRCHLPASRVGSDEELDQSVEARAQAKPSAQATKTDGEEATAQ